MAGQIQPENLLQGREDIIEKYTSIVIAMIALNVLAGSADAWLIKVSGETNITAHPAQINSIENAAGFEAILAIMILLIVYIAGLKRG